MLHMYPEMKEEFGLTGGVSSWLLASLWMGYHRLQYHGMDVWQSKGAHLMAARKPRESGRVPR